MPLLKSNLREIHKWRWGEQPLGGSSGSDWYKHHNWHLFLNDAHVHFMRINNAYGDEQDEPGIGQ